MLCFTSKRLQKRRLSRPENMPAGPAFFHGFTPSLPIFAFDFRPRFFAGSAFFTSSLVILITEENRQHLFITNPTPRSGLSSCSTPNVTS